MRRLAVQIVIMFMTTAVCAARAADRGARIWILPFQQLDADPSLEYLKDALPALVAVAISGSDDYAVVDREHLNALLAEQSLTLEGLISPDSRHRVGRLLGATVIITGSFARQNGDLLIMMRASDLETSVITAAGQARGPIGRPGDLVGQVYRQLAGKLDQRLPDLAPDQIDHAPLANLHFMKGLGHYHSARYRHALAEFMLAAENADKDLSDVATWWLANTYLAQQQYVHAYLELSRLMAGHPQHFREAEVAAKMRECEKRLGSEDVIIIRKVAVARAPGRGRS